MDESEEGLPNRVLDLPLSKNKPFNDTIVGETPTKHCIKVYQTMPLSSLLRRHLSCVYISFIFMAMGFLWQRVARD
jgi:hypothetical protein